MMGRLSHPHIFTQLEGVSGDGAVSIRYYRTTGNTTNRLTLGF